MTDEALSEDERAALWRAQRSNRIQYQVDLWHQLQAPPEPRAAVMAAWEPVILAIAENQAGYIDPKDDP